MTKHKKKFIACPDCRKRFDKLRFLNLHIVKSGHNDYKKISRQEFAKAIDAKRTSVILPC